MPRTPYQAPREWLHPDDRRGFGIHNSPRTLHPARGLDEALHAAAIRQHRLAKKIRDAARDQDVNIDDLATFADLHTDTVRDILNGTSHATLASIAVLARAVGLELRVAAVGSQADRSSP